MHLLYPPDDPHLLETLQYLALGATESPYNNARVQVGTVTLSCTANTLQGQTVPFANPYKKGSTPTVIPGITSLGNTASQVTVSAVNATPTAVTIQAYSSVTQSVTLSFIAIGQTGGA